MILEAKYDRVILWGAKVTGNTITAEIGYFAPNMINTTTVVKVKGGEKSYRIKLLNSVLNKSTPSAGLQLVLPVVK